MHFVLQYIHPGDVHEPIALITVCFICVIVLFVSFLTSNSQGDTQAILQWLEDSIRKKLQANTTTNWVLMQSPEWLTIICVLDIIAASYVWWRVVQTKPGESTIFLRVALAVAVELQTLLIFLSFSVFEDPFPLMLALLSVMATYSLVVKEPRRKNFLNDSTGK